MPRFRLGRILATPGAIATLKEAGVPAENLLRRHHRGDWGELSEADIQANENALKDEARLLSAYNLPNEARMWIITEADRSATTLLLPSEY